MQIKSLQSAFKAIAKRINYDGAVYERWLRIYSHDEVTGVIELQRIVREYSFYDVEQHKKTDKYHYKMAVALYDIITLLGLWGQVADAVVKYDIEKEAG